jgi:NAD+ synthase (glutamine-hydrolysing)
MHSQDTSIDYGNIELHMKLNLALAQINTRLGDVTANLEKHIDYISQARAVGAELLIFPELSLTGYALQDLVSTVAHRAEGDDPVFQQLLQASHDLDLIVGFVEEDQRHRFYIASAYLSDGQVLHVHRKVHLPTYGIFDERRFFAAGSDFRAFETRWGKMGILICEDFWHASSPYLLWMDGADFLLMVSASPGRGVTDEQIGSSQWVQTVHQAYAGLFTTFVAHANRVGFEDGLNFWGAATVFDPDGKMLARGPFNEETITYAELDLAQLRRTRIRLPLLRDERPDLVLKELNRILGS